MAKARMLGVLLCYNDGDLLAESIEYLLEQNHDVIAWDHGSTDETAEVLRTFKPQLVESATISRQVDFYDIYPQMSKHLLTRYVKQYDWISWPDQDEFLEGPTRTRRYADWVAEVIDSPHSWAEFNDMVYWHTDADDPSVRSTRERLRHYALARHGPPKIRAWKSKSTNIRWFNHNRALGSRFPALFNLRHYPMRSEAHMHRRIHADRVGIQYGPVNYHYENMKSTLQKRRVAPEDLHFDDRRSELDLSMIFDWSAIYGTAPRLPKDTADSYLLSTMAWEIAATARSSFETLSSGDRAAFGEERMSLWMQALDGKVRGSIFIAFEKGQARVVPVTGVVPTPDDPPAETRRETSVVRVATMLNDVPVCVVADASDRSVRVHVEPPGPARGHDPLPLLALVPCYGGDIPRIVPITANRAEFTELRTMYYYLICEPRSSAVAS